jgi:hypothetical protein
MRVTILCLLLTAAAAPAAMIAQTEVIAYSPRSARQEAPVFGALGIGLGTLGKPSWTFTLAASQIPLDHASQILIRRKHSLLAAAHQRNSDTES